MTSPAIHHKSFSRKVYEDLFVGYTPFEKIFYPAIILLQVIFAVVYPQGIIGSIVAISGVICVALVGKGRISNYFFGVIQNVLYLYLSLQAVFYGEVMIAVFYVLTQFWGLYTWRKNLTRQANEGDAKDVKTRRIAFTGWAAVAVILALGTWLYGMLLASIGSNQPYIDSFTTTIAVIAQILMVYRYREQWALWIVLNLAQIVLWLTSDTAGSMDMVVMYIAFIFNSIYGWYNWSKLSATPDEGAVRTS
ncbi:nicotinamide riboside transporter PnuC [Rothia terrae]|uniref:Nicotinamide mononucleotide transporter n=1 Tax=Rothia terrae TaxID=396015 RepID=A0A7H2BCZ5_9MICC|nr:nicotinamide riboside transporter PnuC [Rothia terrae]QNV37541.1 nicotinamide mononucleotide transporter [Rothia terrae]